MIILVQGYPLRVVPLAEHLDLPELPDLIRRFLYDQLYPDAELHASDVPIDSCPQFGGRVKVFPSAVTTFYAPSDPSGVGGMHRQCIRATRSWHGAPRHNCIFAEKDPDIMGFRGLHAAQVLLFFSFFYRGELYPCALVQWFVPVGDQPCPDTGMWIVEPNVNADGNV